MRIRFIVLPWHSTDSPSAAASVLTSVCEQLGHDVTTSYGNVQLADRIHAGQVDGVDEHVLSRLEGIATLGYGDWVFAPALYGTGTHRPDQLAAAAADYQLDGNAMVSLQQYASKWLVDFADEVAAEPADLYAITTTFVGQIGPLAFAKLLKQRRPDVPVVLGGASCEGPMGAALHRICDDVDIVIRGEGEQALTQLLAAMQLTDRRARELAYAMITGMCWRDADGVHHENPGTARPTGGADLPPANHDDFFAALDQHPAVAATSQRFVPIESSRGCWWGERGRCTFCNLDESIIAQRDKPADRVVAEVADLVSRHRSLNVFMTDNILPVHAIRQLLPGLADLDAQLRIFYEMKSNPRPGQLDALVDAGVISVQPGIESLSTRVLKIMDKGVTGAQQVQALRDMLAAGLTPAWNFLHGFPGETMDDYTPMLEQIPNLVHLMWPSGAARIKLRRFSRYFEEPELGFEQRTPLPIYQHIFPDVDDVDRVDLAYHFDTPDRGISDQEASAIRDACIYWMTHQTASSLTHRDLGDRIWVYDRRTNRDAADLRLADPLLCDLFRLLHVRPTSLRAAAAKLDVDVDALTGPFDALWAAGLLFEDWYGDEPTFIGLTTPHNLHVSVSTPEMLS